MSFASLGFLRANFGLRGAKSHRFGSEMMIGESGAARASRGTGVSARPPSGAFATFPPLQPERMTAIKTNSARFFASIPFLDGHVPVLVHCK